MPWPIHGAERTGVDYRSLFSFDGALRMLNRRHFLGASLASTAAYAFLPVGANV